MCVVFAFSRPYSFIEIGEMLRRSAVRVRQLYAQAIDTCWRMANA